MCTTFNSEIINTKLTTTIFFYYRKEHVNSYILDEYRWNYKLDFVLIPTSEQKKYVQRWKSAKTVELRVCIGVKQTMLFATYESIVSLHFMVEIIKIMCPSQ